jgi:hypothetical protein
MNIKWWQRHKAVVRWLQLGVGILAIWGLFKATNWRQPTFWSTFKELIVLIGGLVAVITYFRNGVTRRQDIAFRKFDKTIEATQYFRDEISPTIRQTVAMYHRELVVRGYFEMQDNSLKLMVVRSTVAQVNFSNCFKQLNTLAADSRYEMNDYQIIIHESLAYLKRIKEAAV